MSEFTKGDWQYGELTQEIYAEESNGLRTNICKISREDAPEEECQANIQLIASAPTLRQQRDDLLGACKRMLGAMSCDELNNGRVFDDDLRKEVKEKAKVAIANCDS